MTRRLRHLADEWGTRRPVRPAAWLPRDLVGMLCGQDIHGQGPHSAVGAAQLLFQQPVSVAKPLHTGVVSCSTIVPAVTVPLFNDSALEASDQIYFVLQSHDIWVLLRVEITNTLFL